MENIIIETFNSASKKITIGTIIGITIVLVVAIAAFIALSIVHKNLKKKLNVSDDIKKRHAYATAFRIAKILVVIVGIIVILQLLGFNMTGITAIFAVVIVIISLALKDSLQDLFMGFTILMDKYFSVGDAVEYEGQDGIVVSFTVRTTKIEYLSDRSVISVANRNITKIRKLTHLVDIDLPLPYELDREKAYTVLSGVCDKIREVEGIESCEFKGTQEFAASAILYKIRFFCEPNDRPDIRRAVLKIIQDDLKAAEITIPYQQIDIHER